LKRLDGTMIKEANIVEEATIKKYEEYKESCYKK
jgi:hypothetical protein